MMKHEIFDGWEVWTRDVDDSTVARLFAKGIVTVPVRV